jgi:small-conductance mechanosensitive channel
VGTSSTSRGITETDVWQAADALLLEGARPTIERVRQKVGRGSPNTVSPYLDTWFRKLGARIKDPMAFSAPPAIPDPVHQAALHFWEAALATARAQLVSELEAQRATLNDEQRAATEERTALAAERERMAGQVQAREEAVQLLRQQLTDASTRIDALLTQDRERAKELTAVREQLVRASDERDAVRGQLDIAREAHEAARAETEARALAHEKRWTMEVDRAREALKAAQMKLMKLEKDAAVRIDKLSRELQQAAEEHKRSTDAALRREAAQAAQIERLQTQLSKALGQLEAKDQVHGVLLRSLVGKAKATAAGVRPTGKRSSVARR